MMTQKKPPTPTPVRAAEPHDPFKMRTIEQILTLFNNGEFLTEVMTGHQKLMGDLLDHNSEHGPKGCQGVMTLQLSYAVGNQGDVGMGATVTFKAPRKPPSSAAAFIDGDGNLTLYSPMMARMQRPVRDPNSYDPMTGEIRDAE